MEIVLLWLDDLDDLLFTAALVWESLRRALLKIGLGAACALGVCELSTMAVHWVPVFNAIAVASVAAWLSGGLLRAYYRRVRPISVTA
jgi:CHASE2 domain-containing sensor protein